MPRYLISFDDGTMIIPDEDLRAVGRQHTPSCAIRDERGSG